ncbi:MAG: ATP-binding protein [Bacillota bacterium]
MIKFGLTFKIWMAMFALVALVLGLSALFQSGMIERIYINQQADRILETGRDFAREIEVRGDTAEIDRSVYALAGALNASVLVIDSGGNVVSWANRGMGGGMGGGGMGGGGMGRRGMMGGRMHGLNFLFSENDLKEVFSGQAVVRKGNNQFFGFDVILVAIPVMAGEKIGGAVLIHSPLAPIQANVRAIHQAIVYTFLLGAAAATLLALVFSRKVSGPILKMNSAAKAMAQGDFSLKIPVRSGDELGLLAESINTLSRQLKEKIETLKKTDDARRSFVASISHELRTPLTIMQGYTEALMDGIARDDRQREKYLFNIYEETLRLRRLVDDLLDLRKLETGTVSISMERVDLSEVIRSVSEQFSETLNNKDVRIKVEVSPGGLTARGDSDRLKQVVINLVDNAVRFSPAGGTVEIRGERVGGLVKVSVSDQGPGINPEDRQLIWERFYKVDTSRSQRNTGSGLGLAIARQIVELHGGNIDIESKPGEGSTFWFTINTQAGVENGWDKK